MLSVVIMNWARPANVVMLVNQYLHESRVSEVIVWDSSPYRLNLPPHHMLRHVHNISQPGDEWSPMGLYPRYAMGALAAGEAVLIVDDDIQLTSPAISELHDEWMKDPEVLHGVFGRQPPESGEYSISNSTGPVQIVLTRAVVASPWLCARALAWGTRHMKQCPGTPRGNGEDIVLSHVAMAMTGRLNQAHPVQFRNMNYDDKNAISVKVDDHIQHRTAMVRWCRKNILGGAVIS